MFAKLETMVCQRGILTMKANNTLPPAMLYQIRRHDRNTCASSVILTGLSMQDAEEAAAELREDHAPDEYAAGFGYRFSVEMQPAAEPVRPARAPLHLVPRPAISGAASYRVTKTPTMDRPQRGAGIVARGLSFQAAGDLAAALRASDPAANTEAGHVYRVETAPLAEQVELAEAAAGMLAARDYQIAA